MTRHLFAGRITTGLVAVVAVLPAAPASADTADNTVTFTVTGGSLEITVGTARRQIGSQESTVKGGPLSGKIGQVVVSDRRNAPTGANWVASVASTPFTTTAGPAISAKRISYTTGTIHKKGTATYTAHKPHTLKDPSVVVAASDITGDNTATWTPTIHIDLPGGLTTGVYSATITHSVV